VHPLTRLTCHPQVDIKCSSEDVVASVHDKLGRQFPGIVLEEAHGPQLRYGISKATLDRAGTTSSLAALFELLEADKAREVVMEYCVSQTSLESIFIKMAKSQEEETVPIQGMMYAPSAGGAVQEGNEQHVGTLALTTTGEGGLEALV
jgi:hypothetical protein